MNPCWDLFSLFSEFIADCIRCNVECLRMIGGVNLVSMSKMMSNDTSDINRSNPFSFSSLITSASFPALTAFPNVKSAKLPLIDVNVTSVLRVERSKKKINFRIRDNF